MQNGMVAFQFPEPFLSRTAEWHKYDLDKIIQRPAQATLVNTSQLQDSEKRKYFILMQRNKKTYTHTHYKLVTCALIFH